MKSNGMKSFSAGLGFGIILGFIITAARISFFSGVSDLFAQGATPATPPMTYYYINCSNPSASECSSCPAGSCPPSAQTYTNLGECQSAAPGLCNVYAFQGCDVSCQNVGPNNGGTFRDFAACDAIWNTQCRFTINCTSPATCTSNSAGTFTGTHQQCMSEGIAEYCQYYSPDCNSRTCVANQSSTMTLDSCNTMMNTACPRWRQECGTYTCVADAINGTHATEDDCESDLPYLCPNTKFKINCNTQTCSVDANGPFTSHASCQASIQGECYYRVDCTNRSCVKDANGTLLQEACNQAAIDAACGQLCCNQTTDRCEQMN